MNKQIDDPLIRVSINWRKIKGYIVAVLLALKGLGEWILKTILRILTLLIRGLLATYKGLKRFAKSNQKGAWILFLLLTILFLLISSRKTSVQKQQDYQELQFLHQQQLEETERLIEEKKEVQEELEETKEKLEAKLNTPTAWASASVTKAKPLPEDIKLLVAKHADTYGVSRKYCECIITLESGGCSEATGDNGRAHGVAQYHLGTYLSDAKKVGLPVQDDRRNPDRAILAMVAALSRGEDSKWTVSSRCN